MVKAFAYVRVSGQSQVDGDGFPRQNAKVKAYAAANGFRITQTFREEGVSGTIENLNRPAWGEMVAKLHSNGVRTIVIERLDRLARDLMIQETAIAALQKDGFTLISAEEPDLMSSDPTRILMRQLMGAVAQYDKSQIVLKLRGARMRMRAKEGRCEGRKPFGDRDGECDVIDRMESLKAAGLGFDRIAAALNEAGVQTRTRGRWHGQAVNRILGRQQQTKGAAG
jgi:DNA invertase Pin-like site-specific DNA recombinase